MSAPTAPNVSATARSERLSARVLGMAFLALATLTYVLIVFGALVRAHGAGLACPDWPLCFGELVPAMDFKVAFEWGHRALAGSIGLLFLALGGLTLRHPVAGPRLRAGLLAAALLLAVQIVLGGLTVLELLASWTVTSHLVTGNAFALALVLLGRALLRIDGGAQTGPELDRVGRRVVSLAGGLLVLQIVLGGLVSSNYAGLVCPDWPTCMDGLFFPTFRGIQGLHVFHRTVGYGVVLAIGAAAWLTRQHPAVGRPLAIASGLAVAQVVVGVLNVLWRLPVEITALHSALAAGLVCALGVSVRESWRRA